MKLKLHARHQKRIQKTAERRRRVLINNLEEQLKLVHASINNESYVSLLKVWRTNEFGERIQIERPKRMRNWFWVNWSGICFFQVWYGSKVIELQPGMTVVEAATKEKLLEVINSIIEAVKCGDLDIPIEDVAERGLAELRLNHKALAVKKAK